MRIDEIRTIKEFVESPLFFIWRMTRPDKDIHYCYACDLIQNELQKKVKEDTDICTYSRFESFIEEIRKKCDSCWCSKYNDKVSQVLKNKKCNK